LSSCRVTLRGLEGLVSRRSAAQSGGRPSNVRGEARAASSPATANAPMNLLPWDANRAVSIKLIQPAIKFFSLWLRQRYRIWARRKAVPQLLEQLEPLFGAKGRYVNGHTWKV